jgi:MYXO-CTERM domain-containing protein
MVQLLLSSRSSDDLRLQMFTGAFTESGEELLDVPIEVVPHGMGLMPMPEFTVVKPTVALTPGVLLSFSYPNHCTNENAYASILVAEPAPIPTRLGTLHAHEGTGVVQTLSVLGSCVDYLYTGYADLDLELADEARAYRDVWVYQLRVDGYLHGRYEADPLLAAHEHAPWDSSRGRASDRIFASCPRDPLGQGTASYLAAGVHEVVMVGRLPDGTELATDPIRVTLNCPDPVEPRVPGDPDASITPGAEADPEPAADGGADQRHEEYGCSAGRASDAGAAWVLAALALFATRRRRRPGGRCHHSRMSN